MRMGIGLGAYQRSRRVRLPCELESFAFPFINCEHAVGGHILGAHMVARGVGEFFGALRVAR